MDRLLPLELLHLVVSFINDEPWHQKTITGTTHPAYIEGAEVLRRSHVTQLFRIRGTNKWYERLFEEYNGITGISLDEDLVRLEWYELNKGMEVVTEIYY
jgi:hypothetical protein